MKAYISLHTSRPKYQLDNEVSYKGYHRLEVEYQEGDLFQNSIQCRFPLVEESSGDVATHVALGTTKNGQGEVFLTVPILPHIQLIDEPERRTVSFWVKNGATPEQAEEIIKAHGYTQPQVGIGNTDPVSYPEHLNPIARVAHQLVMHGLMETSELHPKLFEAINDALQNAGVPILHVVRGAAARMKIDLNRLAGFSGTVN